MHISKFTFTENTVIHYLCLIRNSMQTFDTRIMKRFSDLKGVNFSFETVL